MKKLAITLLFSMIGLTGCGNPSVVTDNKVAYSPQQDARIRLFGQNGNVSMFWSNIDCKTNPDGDKTNVGGNLSDAFGSLIGTAESHSIGIPETYTTKHISDKNGILSSMIFKEFVVPANKPIIVKSARIPVAVIDQATGSGYIPAGCESGKAAFTPEAGKDYEVISTNGGCGVVVNEVAHDGSLTSTPLSAANVCKQ